jgi:murein DD-endopeptidase MepM/ murein hydrolase activator NlpD
VPCALKSALNMALLSALAVPAYFVFIAPQTAEAGFMSALSGMFRKESTTEVAQANQHKQSLQSIDILETHGGITNPTGGSSITIEDDTLVSEPTVSPAADEYRPEAENISIYEVRKGDNLSEIADMFGVSVNTIKWANNLNGPIKEGQILTILPVTGVKYTVKKGDTVASIAKAYKSDADEILAFNGISGSLTAGQTIIIPDAEIPVTKTSVAASTGKSGIKSSGYFTRPIKGGVRTQGVHGHNGVDLASYSGAPIYAAAAGEVIIAKASGWNGGYGNYVVIRHANGTQTLYAHLLKVQVSAGTRVSQGDQIGTMGNTGKSTGTHLHFEIRGASNPF